MVKLREKSVLEVEVSFLFHPRDTHVWECANYFT